VFLICQFMFALPVYCGWLIEKAEEGDLW